MPRRSLLACLLLGACASAPAGRPGPADALRVAFSCTDGTRFAVIFAPGQARLVEASGRTWVLPQQRSGSGIWYEGEGQTLRGKGDVLDWTSAAGQRHCISAEGAGRAAAALVGSRWRLAGYVLGGGSVELGDPQAYEMDLQAGGMLTMKLDCNRASGRWRARGTGPGQGEFSLAPVAMTRAACPGGPLDVKIAQDAERVRGYRLDGDRLDLILEGDGGVYSWRRIAP